MKILLLSDTHSYIDVAILNHVREADEVWHAGDIGNIEVADKISAIKKFRAVYGNIDDALTRSAYPEFLDFDCEGLRVTITHIGGSPGKYKSDIKQHIQANSSKLFICGHSHILKVVRDPLSGVLHMNPGAAGIHGFHKVRTLLRFEINTGSISKLDVIELGLRGALPQTVG